jgi:hypothetical protein
MVDIKYIFGENDGDDDDLHHLKCQFFHIAFVDHIVSPNQQQ